MQGLQSIKGGSIHSRLARAVFSGGVRYYVCAFHSSQKQLLLSINKEFADYSGKASLKFQRRVSNLQHFGNFSTQTRSSTLTTIIMPAPPYNFQHHNNTSQGQLTFDNLDWSALNASITDQEERKQAAYDSSRRLHSLLVQAQDSLQQHGTRHENTQNALSKIAKYVISAANIESKSNESIMQQLLKSTKTRQSRPANLGHRMEDYARLLAYHYFLENGKLIDIPKLDDVCKFIITNDNDNNSDRNNNISYNINSHELPSVSIDMDDYSSVFLDEEYLAGACMGLIQDLERYSLGRATARDVDSVETARNVVAAILDFLLQIDVFRNGPLRRKYDSCKYVLKSLETLLYELSITGAQASTKSSNNDNNNNNNNDNNDQPASKRVKPDPDTYLSTYHLMELKERMEHRDDLRERLIKESRDGQKAAKQAIFALHRGDQAKAKSLLQTARTCIVEHLWPIVEKEPPLRFGSFANVLEEYVEARLFAAWLYGKDWLDHHDSKISADNNNGKDHHQKAAAVLLTLSDFTQEHVELEDYLGGLCDLTGEIGRYAVQRGTARDFDSVQLCWQTNVHILTGLQSLERLPGGNNINKKMDTLRRSVEKLERIMYEMSLSEATGRNMQSSIGAVDMTETTTTTTNDQNAIDD